MSNDELVEKTILLRKERAMARLLPALKKAAQAKGFLVIDTPSGGFELVQNARRPGQLFSTN